MKKIFVFNIKRNKDQKVQSIAFIVVDKVYMPHFLGSLLLRNYRKQGLP